MPQSSDTTPDQPPSLVRSAAGWLGINRAMMAVLVVTGGLGLSEEIWRNFLSLHLKDSAGSVLEAAKYMGIFAVLVNLMEGFGYIIGGQIAHKLGARAAMLVSAAPMVVGFSVLIAARESWMIILGALLITNWEPLSVPATFEVVGSEVAKNRRTIAFAVQSIQKRLPKVLGPLIGGIVIAIGYWLNLVLAFGMILITSAVQFRLLNKLKPTADPPKIGLRKLLKDIPLDLRRLLTAEIILRWGDWFVRDFAVLYVVGVLLRSKAEAGILLAVTSLTALVTYIPIGKLVDRAKSPKPFIGLTFILFALFPINLVLLPRFLPSLGVPVWAALVVVFILNGLRELGEPARKALISGGFPKETRARSIGLYWGLRSFAFCPAPLVSFYLWRTLGPEMTFLIGGMIGMAGTVWFWTRVNTSPRTTY
jgi:MFS family permease